MSTRVGSLLSKSKNIYKKKMRQQPRGKKKKKEKRKKNEERQRGQAHGQLHMGIFVQK